MMFVLSTSPPTLSPSESLVSLIVYFIMLENLLSIIALLWEGDQAAKGLRSSFPSVAVTNTTKGSLGRRWLILLTLLDDSPSLREVRAGTILAG